MVLFCQVNGIADLLYISNLRIDPALRVQLIQLLFSDTSLLLAYPVSQPIVRILCCLPGLVHGHLQTVQRAIHILVRGLVVLYDAGQDFSPLFRMN